MSRHCSKNPNATKYYAPKNILDIVKFGFDIDNNESKDKLNLPSSSSSSVTNEIKKDISKTNPEGKVFSALNVYLHDEEKNKKDKKLNDNTKSDMTQINYFEKKKEEDYKIVNKVDSVEYFPEERERARRKELPISSYKNGRFNNEIDRLPEKVYDSPVISELNRNKERFVSDFPEKYKGKSPTRDHRKEEDRYYSKEKEKFFVGESDTRKRFHRYEEEERRSPPPSEVRFNDERYKRTYIEDRVEKERIEEITDRKRDDKLTVSKERDERYLRKEESLKKPYENRDARSRRDQEREFDLSPTTEQKEQRRRIEDERNYSERTEYRDIFPEERKERYESRNPERYPGYFRDIPDEKIEIKAIPPPPPPYANIDQRNEKYDRRRYESRNSEPYYDRNDRERREEYEKRVHRNEYENRRVSPYGRDDRYNYPVDREHNPRYQENYYPDSRRGRFQNYQQNRRYDNRRNYRDNRPRNDVSSNPLLPLPPQKIANTSLEKKDNSGSISPPPSSNSPSHIDNDDESDDNTSRHGERCFFVILYICLYFIKILKMCEITMILTVMILMKMLIMALQMMML
jgi:hypothetical protein